MRKISCCAALSALSLAVFAPAESAAAITFSEIPGLIQVTGISADGSTAIGIQSTRVTGEGFTLIERRAVRWRRGSSLDVIGDFSGGFVNGRPLDVSSDGSVVVGVGEFDIIGENTPPWDDVISKEAAFRWTESSGLQALAPLDRNAPNSAAQFVTADGLTVFGKSGSQAFSWTESTGAEFSSRLSYGISGDGQVHVGIGDYPSFRPIHWTSGEAAQVIPVSGSFFAGGGGEPLIGVSDDGKVVFGNYQVDFGGSWHMYPFTWSEGDGVNLISPSRELGVSIAAYDASGDGSVLVGTHDRFQPSHVFRAMMWSEASGLTLLDELLQSKGIDLLGWQLQKAIGISTDGSVIVGIGVNGMGQTSSWMIDLAAVPEPSGKYICFFAFTTLVFGVRKTRDSAPGSLRLSA
ncbi:hypothetical protein [Lacipirellula sp.]|uniref:hypothetical protein n=1 Tax=Lacipirellula sp. TaxID=2691419 RepID=UPI003D0DE484